ncbi:probable membrane-associated kinase regulator 1 [Papaver somniferum]|uniref:probable membrane-associated kinase regulator 1 n=1 Tax=Papaver somniferum TaxID=3469 RepID=UPI000E702640|nr:probable membrane-associated kinase regulator 1 [Papaver somniferum]
MGTVNLCTESPGFIMSPRISFSHNLYQNDVLQIESPHHQQQSHQHLRSDDSLLLEPNFDFCISSDSFIQESSSSADELFSDGKLLPLLLKQKLLPSPQQNSQSHYDPPPPATAAATVTTLETDSTNSSLETDSSTEPDCKEETITEKSSLSSSSTASSNSKSFWGFKRSSSCGNGYKKSLICSLSILPRSNSTGSAPNLKSKETQKQKLQKSKSAYSSSSSGSSLSNSSSSSCQKPPLKKNYGGYNSINGGRMNPAHNVPPPYIPGNLFGLGSLFTSSNGKDKNRKK